MTWNSVCPECKRKLIITRLIVKKQNKMLWRKKPSVWLSNLLLILQKDQRSEYSVTQKDSLETLKVWIIQTRGSGGSSTLSPFRPPLKHSVYSVMLDLSSLYLGEQILCSLDSRRGIMLSNRSYSELLPYLTEMIQGWDLGFWSHVLMCWDF